MTSASDHLHIADLTERNVSGESLEDILRTGPIAPTRVLEIAIQIAEALHPKHEAGLIHGHITAAEIFLEHNGSVSLRHRFRPGSAQEDQRELGRLLRSAIDGATTVITPLCWTIERLLAEKPEDRYASTRDLYLELRAIRGRLAQTEKEMQAPMPSVNTGMKAKPVPNRHAFIALPITLICCCVVIFLVTSHRPVTKRGKVSLQSFPVWSSDGRKILFVKAVNGVDQVFAQASGTSLPVQLTSSPEPSANPRWTQDGSAAVFERAGKSSTVAFLNP